MPKQESENSNVNSPASFWRDVALGVIAVLIAVFAYVWTETQEANTTRFEEYDKKLVKQTEKLDEALDLLVSNQTKIIAIQTKQNSGNTDWNRREGRVLALLEKHTEAISDLALVTARNSERISYLERDAKK